MRGSLRLNGQRSIEKDMNATHTPVLARQVQATVLADIVQALVDGGPRRLNDATWLHERAEAAGLGPHESTALEALRTRLQEGRTLLSSRTALNWF